ncbi:undecaprenyldiphospho-muramoylpentapeptide beta-N-acetylglucosaminyltransferase [Cohnella pontilimi]|uniref:UDP-N-acetylglucosamine--N-acetylmuramyl-(pentapeptide) pyrophosphoryl-undecaprenol N-acetylglucosamine transferase n=1 Tax=Cohnella pontilimi TaxID=2564100 RepID=A0A4V5LT12_9BACL|nr:undecaprenyldiphospho-muramoylpentapeptide beta-N-acetylglucosaminyltransferase [Cohnella pontilimi]
MRRILFTGGGSAGHVTVNTALIPKFRELGWEIYYMGSYQGIEAELIRRLKDVRYIGISTGKLRRYLDWKNVTDPFRVIKGCYEAYRKIKHIKPDVVFSKGGFVSVPVVLGARLNKVPVVIHESDITPGLANRIAIPFASKVCATFPETLEHLPRGKSDLVGAVVREELKNGDAARGLAFCGFTNREPVLLVMGGSLGSQRINGMVRNNLDRLIDRFQIVHICGKGQIDRTLISQRYRQYEYVTDRLPDMMAMADIVVSRAGSNAIFEFLALHKPMLLIPLSKQASRGDQILNAESFEKRGFCHVLREEDMNDDSFVDSILRLYDRRTEIAENMTRHHEEDAAGKVIQLIMDTAK